MPRELKLGPTAQKVLLLLLTGLALGLTHSPKQYFRILKNFQKSWSKIDHEKLHRIIKTLDAKGLIVEKSAKSHVQISLSPQGQKWATRYKIEQMEILKPPKWDGWWHIIIFDIPEGQKKARDAFARTLKKLGFYQLQKSVFVYPYECHKELDIITKFFEIKPHINRITAQKIDKDIELKKYFDLS